MAFFSGTDVSTLQTEGADTNCFVSLIVDTKGTYQAAVTRKVVTTTEIQVVSSNQSYEFFGDGPVRHDSKIDSAETTEVEEDVEIQYFMLDVEREVTNNPFDYLDARFEEIEAKKREASRKLPVYTQSSTTHYGSDYDYDFHDWIRKNGNIKKDEEETKVYTYASGLFDKETMDAMVDPAKWEPDPTIIHYLAVQLVTCSLIVSKDLDLKQWVAKWMTKKYSEIFKGTEEAEMDNWADFYVEFILNHYDASEVPDVVLDDFDTYLSSIAFGLIEELELLPENPYIEVYKTKLTMYTI